MNCSQTLSKITSFLASLAAMSASMGIAQASGSGHTTDGLFFQKTLSLNEEGAFEGKLVSGDPKCEDKIIVLIGNSGLYYDFRTKNLKSKLNGTPSLDRWGINPYAVTETKERGSYWLGTDESSWEEDKGLYPHYRPLDSPRSWLYSKSRVDVSIDSGKVIVVQTTDFKDKSGIWSPVFFPIVEEISKRILFQRLENGDLWYTVSQSAAYEASENEYDHVPFPAGTTQETVNCRYKDVTQAGHIPMSLRMMFNL